MSAFEKTHRDLLRAGRREVAPAALRERLFGSPPPPVVPPPASTFTSLFAGVVAAGLALVLVHFDTQLAPVAPVVVAPAIVAPAPVPVDTPPTSVAAAKKVVTSGPPVSSTSSLARSATPATKPLSHKASILAPSAAEPNPTAVDGLGAEVALLGAAKRALSGGDVVSADAALASYTRSFPAGALKEEAEALRIERAIRFGDRTRAAAALEAFERAHPRSPVAARLRHMLEGAESP